MTALPSLLTNAQTSSYRALKRSKYRRLEGLFLLEGARLCEEALHSDLDIIACITSKNFDRFPVPPDIKHFEATPVQIEQISDSKSPQGIICVARIPEAPEKLDTENTQILLVLDRISDPGNMGTIFRSALWFGIQDILLGPDCVDPYSPKVVRGSMGALGTLNLHTSADLCSSAEDWKAKGGDVVALHMQGTSLHTFKAENPLFLIVGSEAHGVDQDLLKLSTPLSIEKPGAGESLNAAMATGIALFELSKP
ncbi:MAG: RNA methyltransferase [Candidatus Marinimicrobia bacterium]|jgi:RNA methyltransferase, TrmH family|nr:RNA methyltransferase [Candidatus Neomarinimicrobiota bacterium]MBT4359480.1 RNA methyltransferase [Candidatus Neomarinimicrobiota bacterium]MBT4714908.1 RNA methyltransferase [Candidatus Neomarinimicrobiota bacterium]MBT4946003.1 RNA methyltransferase [Candidatus Neomarinimicrobiota bacterium]MBT5269280.1 RNA methyltransferase [Candidatus Neomarinimicrobiota bacterium]